MGEESPAPAKVYYDGCPGCAMDRKKETQSGVPYKELLFVATTTFASGTSTYYYSPTPDAHDADSSCYLLCSFHFFIDPSIPTAETSQTTSSEEGRQTVLFYCLRATLLFDLGILY